MRKQSIQKRSGYQYRPNKEDSFADAKLAIHRAHKRIVGNVGFRESMAQGRRLAVVSKGKE